MGDREDGGEDGGHGRPDPAGIERPHGTWTEAVADIVRKLEVAAAVNQSTSVIFTGLKSGASQVSPDQVGAAEPHSS